MKLPVFPYGGDYNPEQWPREVWEEDVALMGRAHVNVATLPVFGWAALEPEEGRFEFEWLDDILDRLHRGGVTACLATATASVPAWLTQRYPDVLVVGEDGVRRKHGNRHTFCPNSPNYRRLATLLVRKLAERYGQHPALLLWHVNNEYGGYCFCDQCAAAFRGWLRARYGTLAELNDRWYTSFWGHTYTDWEQIDTPTKNGEHSIQALKIDYHRFQSESLLDCYRAEAQVLREVTPDVPITTNLMGAFFPLDYHQWAKEMNVVSWDNYPYYNAEPADVAFAHALMRGLKEGQPFLLLEQSPSQQNWAPYNRLKPPGQLRLQSYQAVAHGADSVMYFQWRRGRGGIEKLHGAVMEHGGSPENRVFREVAALGAELQRVGGEIQGKRVPARVAVLFDWPNWWGLRYSSGPSKDLDYPKVVRAFFAALHGLGIQVEVVSPSADMAPFDVIVAPLLTMLRQEDADRITCRVEQGASLVATFFSGLTDDTDRVYLEGPPGPWREVLGISVEETDALPPELPNGLRWGEDEEHDATLLADRVRLEGAEVLATYTRDFYAGEPAVTRNRHGEGRAYYVATLPEAAGLRHLISLVCAERGVVSPLPDGPPPAGIEVTARGDLLFLLNYGAHPATVRLPEGSFVDHLTGDSHAETCRLEPLAVLILQEANSPREAP